jgi:cell wall-associated NlpC family hydrolase
MREDAGQPSPNPTAHPAGGREGHFVPVLNPARKQHALAAASYPVTGVGNNAVALNAQPTAAPHSGGRATGLPLLRQRFAALLLALTAIVAVGACSAPRPSGIGGQAVAIAAEQQGKPYVWAAAGPYAFDCSGLTMYVYGRLGRSIPHNTNSQYAAVAHISQGAKAPGDLIFFGSPGNVYHVGIYAGGDMMWHAPHSGTVVQLSPIWTSDYLVGRV